MMSCVFSVVSEFQHWFLGQSGLWLQQSLPQRSVCASVCVIIKRHCGFSLTAVTCVVAVGIPYLTKEEESQLRDQYEERRSQINGNCPITFTPNSGTSVSHIPEDQRAFIKTVEWVMCGVCTRTNKRTTSFLSLHWNCDDASFKRVCLQRESWRSSEELWEISGPRALHRVSLCKVCCVSVVCVVLMDNSVCFRFQRKLIYQTLNSR